MRKGADSGWAIAPRLPPYCWQGLTYSALAAIFTLGVSTTAGSLPSPSPSNPLDLSLLQRPNSCPSQIQPLTQALLRDLPAYLNRVYARVVYPQVNDWSYAIIASQPEFEPLPVASTEYPNPTDDSLKQIFFTVLERQYRGSQATLLQHYHWLFLTQTENGWQIAFMFSRIGSYPATPQSLLTPPRTSDDAITAQAIRLWLRDCRAGKIKL